MNKALRRVVTSPVNYWLGFVLDVGGSFALVTAGLVWSGRGLGAAAGALALGLGLYTLYEYAAHRWLYHAAPPPADDLHALHHERPRAIVGAPFFFTPAVCAANWGLARLVVGPGLAAVFAGAVLLGFACQSVAHHLFHARGFAAGSRLDRLRRHHLLHHRDGTVNFGVITSFWDHLCGTWRRADRRR